MTPPPMTSVVDFSSASLYITGLLPAENKAKQLENRHGKLKIYISLAELISHRFCQVLRFAFGLTRRGFHSDGTVVIIPKVPLHVGQGIQSQYNLSLTAGESLNPHSHCQDECHKNASLDKWHSNSKETSGCFIISCTTAFSLAFIFIAGTHDQIFYLQQRIRLCETRCMVGSDTDMVLRWL